MKSYLFVLLCACLASSCNLFTNYGKKVDIGENEVFYKGDGVTEGQAKAVGNFLKEHEWFNDKVPASAQISKEDDTYMVRLVVADPDNIATSLRMFMWKQQYDLSEEVFKGKDTRFVFADSKFKDLDVLEPVAKIEVGKSAVYYDNSEYKKKQAQGVADLLKEKLWISEESAGDVLFVKEDGNPVIRLIADKKTIETREEEVMPTFSYWQWLIQQNVLDNKKAKIILATVNMKDFKTVPKLTEEMRQRFETPDNYQQPDNTFTMDSISTQTTVSGIERIRD